VYEAFEIANHHSYLGRWKLFFSNTVYRLLFSFGHPPFFFSSITLVLLVFPFFQRFARNGCFSIVPHPYSHHLFCLITTALLGSFYLCIYNNSKWSSQRRKETNVWGFLGVR
jgi:hypothetical protein